MNISLTERTAKILLLSVIAARATSFCFSKMCLMQLTPFALLGIRFTFSFVLLCLIFLKQLKATLTRSDLLKGILFGTFYYLVMTCEYSALQTTNSSTASFLENLAIVIVPFLNIPFTRKLPSLRNLFCVFLAVIGVGLLTLTKDGFSLSAGEMRLILAAFLYASAIIATNMLSKTGTPLNMGIFQVGTIGILGLISAGVTNTFCLPADPFIYVYVAALSIVCTCFGYTLQPVAQSKLSAETSSLYCAVSPLVASIIGIVFLHEIPSFANVIGEILIIIVLIFS